VAASEITPGERIVAEWATTRPGITGRERARLAAAVNSLLRDGGLPELVPAALDAAHDNPKFHSPDKALPFAYADVRRARQAADRPAPAGAHRPAGRLSRTDRARAAVAAAQARYGNASGVAERLELPAAGSDR
jgi:hypothetical protein